MKMRKGGLDEQNKKRQRRKMKVKTEKQSKKK